MNIKHSENGETVVWYELFNYLIYKEGVEPGLGPCRTLLNSGGRCLGGFNLSGIELCAKKSNAGFVPPLLLCCKSSGFF